jgi:hypothetical protein
MVEAHELQGSLAPSPAEARRWIGFKVEDVYGSGVGRVHDVLVDRAGESAWLVVRERRFTSQEALVPVDDAIGSGGYVWVPYAKDAIRSAPSAPHREPIEGDVEAHLREYYAAHKPVEDASPQASR